MKKDYKPVYVRGTETGNGVIEALKALGGINKHNLKGDNRGYIYFIGPESHTIAFVTVYSIAGEYIIATAKEIKPLRWRAKNKGQYYAIGPAMKVVKLLDYRDVEGARLYNCGNYFRTEEEAQEMAEKIKKVLLPD